MKEKEILIKVLAPYIEKGMHCLIGYQKQFTYNSEPDLIDPTVDMWGRNKNDLIKSNDINEIVDAIISNSFYIAAFIYEGVKYGGITYNNEDIISFDD